MKRRVHQHKGVVDSKEVPKTLVTHFCPYTICKVTAQGWDRKTYLHLCGEDLGESFHQIKRWRFDFMASVENWNACFREWILLRCHVGIYKLSKPAEVKVKKKRSFSPLKETLHSKYLTIINEAPLHLKGWRGETNDRMDSSSCQKTEQIVWKGLFFLGRRLHMQPWGRHTTMAS